MTKQQLWQQRITDWQKSGLTQRAFCHQHGIALSTFNTWLRKIRNQSGSKAFPESSFLPVVVDQSTPQTPSAILVRTHGIEVEVSIHQLAQLITELNHHA